MTCIFRINLCKSFTKEHWFRLKNLNPIHEIKIELSFIIMLRLNQYQWFGKELINYCLSGWLLTVTHKGNVAYDKYKCTYCRLSSSYVDCMITHFEKETFDANCNYLCKEYRAGEGTFSRSTVLPISLQVAALLVVQQITVVSHSQRRLLCLC